MSNRECARVPAAAILVLALLSGCGVVWPVPTPTTAPATATPTMTPSPSPSPSPSPTATEVGEADDATSPSTAAVVVAGAEGTGTFAVASLAGVSLEGGREYVLQVTSHAGSVSFFGSYSSSAMGGDGKPGVEVELLDGTTPIVYPITPPAPNPTDWLHGVSVQSRGSGGIILTILDVTGDGDPADSGRRGVDWGGL